MRIFGAAVFYTVLTTCIAILVATIFVSWPQKTTNYACRDAAVAAQEYIQAEDAAFELILSCSLERAPEKLCTEEGLRKVTDHAKDLHIAFYAKLKGCIQQ